MIETIVKRDGRQVPFDPSKITDAIYKAAQVLGGNDREMAEELTEKVIAYLTDELHETRPAVEQVQDVVEKVLIENGHARTAKEYILYRAERTRVRDMNTKLMRIYEDLTFKPAADNDIKRENANIDGDTAMGTMLKYGSVSAKEFYEMYVLEPQEAKAHINGDIHIHDLDFLTLTTTCCQIDLIKLFKDGFSTGHGYLREPNDIASYSALACIAIQSNQNDQHGGQSVPNFDYAMAEGVKKTYRARYAQNIARCLAMECDLELNECDKLSEQLAAQVQQEQGLIPILADNNGYREAELPGLTEICGSEALAKKIQDFAVKAAYKETNRATYQAMEALIHNLNTMNSRAGAQTPFSSINYGTDTLMDPEDIANVIAFLVSPLAHGINGNVLFVDGGTDALLNSEKVY